MKNGSWLYFLIYIRGLVFERLKTKGALALILNFQKLTFCHKHDTSLQWHNKSRNTSCDRACMVGRHGAWATLTTMGSSGLSSFSPSRSGVALGAGTAFGGGAGGGAGGALGFAFLARRGNAWQTSRRNRKNTSSFCGKLGWELGAGVYAPRRRGGGVGGGGGRPPPPHRLPLPHPWAPIALHPPHPSLVAHVPRRAYALGLYWRVVRHTWLTTREVF